jgi:hypothetical protein
MAAIRAYVYKDSGFIDSYKIYPPVVIVTKNDTFELVNTVDNHDAEFTVPSQFDYNGPQPEKIKPGKKSSKTLKNNAVVAAVEYEVKVDGHKAKGNSDPVIIIDP